MPRGTSAVQEDFAHLQKVLVTDWINAYGCVSLWWLGSVLWKSLCRAPSKISFSLHGRDPCHKHGICTHEVVFIKWAYFQDTAPQNQRC